MKKILLADEVKPDLIMADVAMPGKNGYEVCEAVKNDPDLSTTPVMLLAGTFEPLNDEEASRVRADDHIVKPFESEVLIEKVKTLLERPPKEVAPAEGLEAEAFSRTSP
jgi:CheY-like chemotaxis protein